MPSYYVALHCIHRWGRGTEGEGREGQQQIHFESEHILIPQHVTYLHMLLRQHKRQTHSFLQVFCIPITLMRGQRERKLWNCITSYSNANREKTYAMI